MKNTRFSRMKMRFFQWILNSFLCGTHFYGIKRALMKWAGVKLGKNVQIVGPFRFDASDISIDDNCWIGKNFEINGHGRVHLEKGVGIAPNTRFYTGKHVMGPSYARHEGEGVSTEIYVREGAMVSADSIVIGPVDIGRGSVVMVGSCVTKSCGENVMIGGVPAKVIKAIEE